MIRISSDAAKLVRKATTANGENLSAPIAALPNTGVNPKKSAETRAALIPVLWPLNDFVIG
jgi:hypothetical protein